MSNSPHPFCLRWNGGFLSAEEAQRHISKIIAYTAPCRPGRTMRWGVKSRVKLVCRLLEYGSGELLAIGIDEVDLDGPCALRVTFDTGGLVTIGSVSAFRWLARRCIVCLPEDSHDILLGRYLYLTRDLVLDLKLGLRSSEQRDRAIGDGWVTYVGHVEAEQIFCDGD